jgi:hypothetical protein
MKQLTGIAIMVFLLAACNLSDKFKKSGSASSNSSNSNSSTSSDATGDEPAEKPNPTAAQTAAIANGQELKWDQQGITWTLPAHWKKSDVSTESLSYGGGGAYLSVVVSVMPQMEKLTDISSKAMHEAAKTNQKIGKYDEVKWLEIDGVRGVEFRESKPQMDGDIRRLEWQAYRTFAGSTQLLTVILSSNAADFPKHEDELYGILYSTKLVH